MTSMSFRSMARWILLFFGCSLPLVMTGCGCGGGGGGEGAAATAVDVETISPPADGRPPGEGPGPEPLYDGKVLTLIGEGAEARASVRDTSDRILVAGFAHTTKQGASKPDKDFALVRYMPDGTLDKSFGNGNGIVVTDVGIGKDDEAYAVAIQPENGFIVVAGYSDRGSYRDFSLVRYDIDGRVDSSFGSGGMVTSVVSDKRGENRIRALAIQSDGKILAAGYSNPEVYSSFAVARFTNQGALDSSFNSGRIVMTSVIPGGISEANAIATDGSQIFVAGFAQNPDVQAADRNEQFALACYGAGAGGLIRRVTTSIGSGNDRANAIAFDGTYILVAGYSEHGSERDFALVRYNKGNGSLDPLFDTDGKVTTSLGDDDGEARAMALLPDGKILLAGTYYVGWAVSHIALARYHANGSLDSTFGANGNGMVKTIVGGAEHDEAANALVVRTDGRFVVAGFARDPFPVKPGSPVRNDFAVVGYMPDGSLDTSFGK